MIRTFFYRPFRRSSSGLFFWLNSRRTAPYLFLLPFLITFGIFWIAPIIGSLGYSFTDWSGSQDITFIGLENYARLLKDPRFLVALKNTLFFSVVYVSLVAVLSLIIGLLLNIPFVRLKGIFRSAYFAPITVSIAVVAIIFSMMYARDIGSINIVLGHLGMKTKVDWLGDARVAMWSIIILRVWRVVGYYAAIVLAGLQSIPSELYEAAIVDGASDFQATTRITIPLLRPVILFIVTTSTIWAIMLFDEPWILTKGGPADSTLTLGVYLYQHGFTYFRLGYSAAISYAITIIILFVSLIQNKLISTEDLA
jgi:ABC-type sugar transport system permease subunit